MKRGLVFFLLVFPVSLSLFAFGGKETAEEKKPVNPEYVLCITSPDVSTLPPSQQIMGDSVVREIANALSALSYRLRGEDEAAYYQDYAWAKSRTTAAKALEAKRNERDLLIYRGDPAWKYRKNLKTVDAAILKLEAELMKIDSLAPVAEAKPVFMLSDKNRNGIYPAPPSPGAEYRFCLEQKVDAFLTVSLLEYHNRIYLDIGMYTRHTGSFSYEDSVLFSSEDLNETMDEISGRLAAAVSETLQAAILVHATPSDAMVMIDGSFTAMGEKQTRLPGTVELSIHADNYSSFPYQPPFQLELNAGEFSEFFIALTPLSLSAFEATVTGSPGSRVYLGSLYAGETPLSLELPSNDFTYISVETPEGQIGSAVYRDNTLVRGNAQFLRQDGGSRVALFNTKNPVSPEDKRVDRARRGFYGAYGAFWIILPVALLASGIAGSYILAHNYVVETRLYEDDYDLRKDIYDRALTGRNVQIAATIGWGTALGVTFFQIFRYLYVSGADSTPIVKAPPKEKEATP